MDQLRIDPAWVSGYAKTVRDSGDRLGTAAEALTGDPLGADVFGDLGRQVRTADAYLRASTRLREQLTRAVESLRSASDGLGQVTKSVTTAEDDRVIDIDKTDRDRR